MIGIVNDNPPSSGIGHYSFELFNQFRKSKKPVDMIYLDYYDKMNDKKIKPVKKCIKFPFFRKTLNWYFYSYKQIPKNYGLYHMTCHYHALFSEHLKPSVITYADILPFVVKGNYPSFINYFFKKSMEMGKHADRIIAMSKNTKRDIVEILKIPGGKIKVIYNGIDHSTFKPRNKEKCRDRLLLPKDKRIVLNVGSEEPRKNIPSLLNAFKEISKTRKDVVLIRIGKASRESSRIIRDSGLKDRVMYFSDLTKEDLSCYYAAADVFVMPSHYEGFGFPAIEAMACGCPVIASFTSSLGEMVKNAGLLINPDSLGDIVNKMEELLDEKSLRKKMSRKGIKRARAFTWKNCAEETWKVYEEVLE